MESVDLLVINSCNGFHDESITWGWWSWKKKIIVLYAKHFDSGTCTDDCYIVARQKPSWTVVCGLWVSLAHGPSSSTNIIKATYHSKATTDSFNRKTWGVCTHGLPPGINIAPFPIRCDDDDKQRPLTLLLRNSDHISWWWGPTSICHWALEKTNKSLET